jgi:hypothetical protein
MGLSPVFLLVESADSKGLSLRLSLTKRAKFNKGYSVPGAFFLDAGSQSRQLAVCWDWRARPVAVLRAITEVTSRVLERLRKIINKHVGVIELADDLDIETINEMFIRVSFAGTELSQADFAMSKISVNKTYGSNLLRNAIQYLRHCCARFLLQAERATRLLLPQSSCRRCGGSRDVHNDIYDPTYTDMLRLAFTSEFHRGKLQDLVALVSGHNFEMKQYEEAVAEESFA